MRKKVDTHKMLVRWHKHSDYPVIARYASNLSSEGMKPHDILDMVSRRYTPILEGRRSKISSFPIFGEHLIDNGAIHQMNEALHIPPALRGALMPDAHRGYALPIGAAIELDNAISPSFIGYDISCMLMLTILDIDIKGLNKHLASLFNILGEVTSFGMGSEGAGLEHPVMETDVWDNYESTKKLKPLAQLQLGSSGGGNHFANLMVGKWGRPEGMGQEFVALLTHSGSRGTGHQLATHYAKEARRFVDSKYKHVTKDYEWLELDTDIGKEYQRVMWLMGEYAYANHELIHKEFMEVAVLEQKQRTWNRHNFAWVGEVNQHHIIHRKGATPAADGKMGLVPGSSGSNSYLTIGKGNNDSLQSSAHGAGRPHSRTQAKDEFDSKAFTSRMNELGVMHKGVDKDEGYLAYKNIEEVMEAQRDLVTPIARMQPRAVIMGGKADDGD